MLNALGTNGFQGSFQQSLRTLPTTVLPTFSHVSLQVRFRAGKRKKRAKWGDRPPELKDMKGSVLPIRLEDRAGMGPESPYSVAKNINQYLNRLTADEGKQFHYRRSKDFTYRHKHRMLRFAGLTHDFAGEEDAPTKRVFTPLEDLQQHATLPRNTKEIRFPFPHLLSYKVYWGSDVSTMENPNEYDTDSMKSCSITFDVADLELSSSERERLVKIAGPKNCVASSCSTMTGGSEQEDSSTGAMKKGPQNSAVIDVGARRTAAHQCDIPTLNNNSKPKNEFAGLSKAHPQTHFVGIDCDIFPDRNHNAALVGDMVEALIREAKEDTSQSNVSHQKERKRQFFAAAGTA